MTPQTLLAHLDSGQLWPAAPSGEHGFAPSGEPGFAVAAAYQQSLAVRTLRVARGEVPRGYKIGFTNRSIWPRYNVFAPIWGTVWDTTLAFCDGQGSVSLARTCQPRIEPEAVFGLRATPPADATLDDLFDSLDWVAPGFEIVQSHLPDWKFAAADTVADGGLHARLMVGAKVPVRNVAASAAAFDAALGAATVTLRRGTEVMDQGRGTNVLDGPLQALHHFLQELRACPGATDLQPGDVVTTGTWTDAWAVAPGETWQAAFDAPLSPLEVRFT